jgi:hypothetical protein
MALSQFVPLLYEFFVFLVEFSTIFGEGDCERVDNTKIQTLKQGSCFPSIFGMEFQQLAYDLNWNEKVTLSNFI